MIILLSFICTVLQIDILVLLYDRLKKITIVCLLVFESLKMIVYFVFNFVFAY